MSIKCMQKILIEQDGDAPDTSKQDAKQDLCLMKILLKLIIAITTYHTLIICQI